jgi:iron complex outermembrane recepter protein
MKATPALLAGLAIVIRTAVPGSAEQTRRATLAGTVSGPDGVRIPGVTLTLTDEITGATVRAASGEQGTLRIPALQPGSYTLRAEAPGFQPAIEAGVVLAPDETRTVQLVLRLAGLRETLTVVGVAGRDSLEATAIRESPARDVGEALGATPGVHKLRKGGIANDVVLRGLKGADVNVLLDGQRLHGACPNRMDPAAFHVDFAEVERVEVAKGPFDMKSQGGLGGAVNIVTRRPESGWRAGANLGLGGFGFVNPSLTASYGSARLAGLAGFSYRRSEPFEDGAGRRFTEIANYRSSEQSRDAFRLATGWTRVGFQPSAGHHVQLAWTRQQADDVLYPYLQMDALYDDTDRINLIYEAGGATPKARALTVQAYYSGVDHWMTDQFRTSSVGTPRGYSMGTRAMTRTLGGRVELRASGASVGVEAYRHRWDTTTELSGMAYQPQASLPEVGIESLGAYGELTRSLGAPFELTLGARLDHVRSAADESKANTNLYYAYHGTRSTARSDTRPSGRLRLSWQAASGLSVSASLGHAVRTPDANERYFALRRMGSDWVGNPELSPSRNTGVEIQARYERAGAALSASLFWNHVDDFITVSSAARVQAVPGVMNTRARTWTNVDATLRGGEASGTLPLRGHLFLSGELSAVRGLQRVSGSGADSDLAEMPPLRGRLGLRYDDGRLFALAEGVFAADQDRVDAALGEQPTPGWGVASLSAGWRTARLTLTGGVTNLFDRAYAEHLSFQRDPFRSGVRVFEPGRSAFLSASLRLP